MDCIAPGRTPRLDAGESISMRFSHAVPVVPFTREMAQKAAKIDADARQLGKTVPMADLLIGATALHLGYAVATANLRHFE